MRLFGLFGKGSKEQPKENEQKTEENSQAEITAYSGMRVEVTTFEGELLFVAKLVNLRENQAVLQQYSETERSKEILQQYTEEEEDGKTQEAGSGANAGPESLEVVFARMLAEQAEKEKDSEEEKQKEPLHVRIRGYNDHERKAVYMEGFITPEEKHTWKVEELTVTRIGNDRAFFRLETNLDAVVTTFGGFSAREQDCKMLNISVGGARILSEQLYHEGDKFLLKVQLLEDRPMSVMFCEVLRVFEREDSKYEYGCRFLELNEEDQDKITQNIFAAQLAERRKKRGAS